MIALRHFLEALATVVGWALDIYMWLIIARAILSWVNPDPYNPIVRFLYSITEPLLSAVRRRLPLMFGGMDFTPLVILAAILFLKIFLVQTILDYARLIQ